MNECLAAYCKFVSLITALCSRDPRGEEDLLLMAGVSEGV